MTTGSRSGSWPVPANAFDDAVEFVEAICEIAHEPDHITALREALGRDGILDAVRDRHTPVLFEWLMTCFSYQGISDQVADSFQARHGGATWAEVSVGARIGSCPRLESYWTFEGCRFEKWSGGCGSPAHLHACPLPRLGLRNGRLNQTAYSLFLFIRDVAGGNLVAWFDARLSSLDGSPLVRRDVEEAVVAPLGYVYGVSNKVVSMTLATLFLAAGGGKPRWRDAGAELIAIDTLVHNLLHRSGILRALDADHAYGLACYRPNGCADLVERFATAIDCRRYGEDYPTRFPRLIQHALWRYCAGSEFGICNGNQIDDKQPCASDECSLWRRCQHLPIR